MVPAAPAGVGKTFRSLRHRNFRYLWMGQVGHAAALWMDQVARAVLILQLTDSAIMLSAVIATRLAPILVFSLIAGVAADRYDRRRILMGTQAVTFLSHVLLGLMVVIGAIETWHVFATALIAGTAMAFNQPVRQALIPTVVPRDDLMNAVALNSAAVSFMRIGGGSIAGVLLIWFSTGGVYLITACIYVFVILTTLLVQADGEASRRSQTGWFADLKDGLNYVASNPTLGLVTLLAGILFIFGFPYQSVFVPLLATRTLGIGDSGVGFLMGATGLGAFAGSIFVAWRSGVSRPGVQLMVNMLVFGLSLVLVALQATVIGTALLLAVAGAMTVTYMAFTNAILLEHSSPEMHGRVMSLLSLDRGLIPLGAIMAGVLVSAIGVRPGVFVMGAVAASMAGLALLFAGRQLASIRGSITDVRSGEGPDTREPPDDGPEAGATIAQPGG